MITDKQDIHQSNCKVVKYKFDDIYKHLNLSLKKCVDMACEKAPLLGSLLSSFRSMVTLYTSEHSSMQYFRYGWRPLTFPLTVFAGNCLLSNMLYVAPLEVFLPSDAMSSVMLLLTYFLRSAQMYRSNHSFNLLLVNHCPTVLETLTTCQIGYICKKFLSTSHEQTFFDVRVFNPLVKSH